jgi:transcription antitermination factor NusG
MKWYVVRTTPGQQRRAMTEYAEAKIEAYCPMARRETRHFQSKKWVMRSFPLFTGYAFVRLVEGDFGSLYRLDNTASILGGSKGPISVADEEIVILQDEEARGAFDILRPPPAASLKPDSRVYIQSGPLQGHYASVTQARGKKAVRIIVDSIAGMREIEVNIANIQLVA